MKTGIIYRTTNLVNGKHYIGQTTQGIERRKYEHFYYKNRDNSKFRTALRKYKPEDWGWEILSENVPQEYLNELEVFLIWFHDCHNQGYNSTLGGDDNPMNGKKHTEEAKQKMSKAHLGQTLSEEHKRKLILSRVGTFQSEEAKLKISIANKGKTRSEVFKKQLSQSLIGNKRNLGKTRNEEKKRLLFTYKVTRPDDTVEITKNLRNYCKENKLTFSHMYEIIKSGRKHKGYRVEKING